MKIKVLFFGLVRDLTGFDQESLDVPEGEKVEYLWRLYQRRFPDLVNVAGSLVTAVNQEVAKASWSLRDGDEVAFLPPVSGGSGRDILRIVREPVQTQSLARQLQVPQDGAVVIFEGIVRDHSNGRKTLYLEYEAYEPMAVRKMEEITQEAHRKFDVDAIAIVHRVGRLEIGETSVAVVVTSAHRQAAFEACHYAIDRLKQVVPIWKKEFFEDGAVWAEGEGQKHVLLDAPSGR